MYYDCNYFIGSAWGDKIEDQTDSASLYAHTHNTSNGILNPPVLFLVVVIVLLSALSLSKQNERLLLSNYKTHTNDEIIDMV